MTWLTNLLPEGDALGVIGQRFGVSRDDIVAIVEIVGRDTAGALSVGQPRDRTGEGYRPIPDQDALERIIEELPKRPFLAGDDGISMSLAGAQEKLPVRWDDGVLSLPLNGAPSTHIIKPDNNRLNGSVQNEALCMTIARQVGLHVAEVTTGLAGDRSYLLVRRYDRTEWNDNWLRLHQEDFCQALTRPPAAKYQHNRSGFRGPGLADFFSLVRKHMTARDTAHLVDAVIFNVLITNVDSHAKNYSIMLRGAGASLAPLYDLMCGDVWPQITQNLPQDIGGKNRGRHIHQRHWRRMAKECGLSGTGVVNRVRELAGVVSTRIAAAADEVRAMPAGDHPILRTITETISDRCQTALSNLESDLVDEFTPDDAGRVMDDLATPSG